MDERIIEISIAFGIDLYILYKHATYILRGDGKLWGREAGAILGLTESEGLFFFGNESRIQLHIAN